MKNARDPIPTLKRQLVGAILDRFSKTGQLRLARQLGVDQPRVSNLQRGRLERFSLQRLVRLVARVDGEVTLSVMWTYSPAATVAHRAARAAQAPPSTRQ